jgi:hypothetical protein
MANQDQCRKALEEVAQAVNNMYKPLPTGQAAIDAGREVMEKVRQEIYERTGEKPWEKKGTS